jgi:hypothetical protein
MLPQVEPPQDQVTEWRSCCLSTDKHVVVYISQLVFSTLVFGFCCIMLVQANGECEASSPYLGLISFLLGKLLSVVAT